jgi:hypothetical protein
MYASKALTNAELQYLPYEQESLAMVWSMEVFRHYLAGRPFIVRTDCQALQWLKDQRPKGARIQRWLCRLQEFDYKVVHRPGAKSTNVDPLTRQPLPGADAYGVEPFETLPIAPLSAVLPVLRSAAKRKAQKDPTDVDLLPREKKLDGCETDYKHGDADAAQSRPDPKVQSPPSAAEDEVIELEPPQPNPFVKRRPTGSPFFDCEKDGEAWNASQWAEHQISSKYVRKLRETMTKKTEVDDNHALLQGVLHRKGATVAGKQQLRVVVPESLRAFVIGQHHNLELAGHQGRRRTMAMIGPRYFWPGMSNDIGGCAPALAALDEKQQDQCTLA